MTARISLLVLLLGAITFGAVTVAVSAWETSQIRRAVANNVNPAALETGCFMALYQERTDWQSGPDRLGDLYRNTVWPESTRQGQPAYPPIQNDNVIYLYAACSPENRMIGDLVFGLIQEASYREQLDEFGGATAE